MAMHSDPFLPPGPVTRDRMRRYLRGELDAAERNRIERHLEQDPLLREAFEGLQAEGALEALDRLPRRAPGGPSGALRLLIAGGIILTGLTAALLWVKEEPPAPALLPADPVVADRPFRADSAIAVVEQELEAARPVPPTLQIGHEAPFEPTARPMDTTTVEPLPLRRDTTVLTAVPQAAPAQPSPEPPTPVRSGRQLAFVHDLKLVDPKELYDQGPLLMELGGVPADQADADAMRRSTEVPRTMRYLDFMDAALAKFIRNDHRGCLQDLLFLLGQYPKDINARFYAGLCCYNLGLPERAKGYLQAVVSDPIDTFQEEASWYLALSIERADGAQAAHPHFERVAAEGGHYAVRAQEKLNP